MTETSIGADYMLGRSFRDSARLYLQHWIWKEHLGYILHPSIPRTAVDWKVADIGTGNGCWLFDLAQEVPSSWSLEGFDVSDEQFPASFGIPNNVSLSVKDAFGAVPAHLQAKFDVVHIRAFAVVVKGGNPHPLLQNLVQMLKPGGFLQWDDFDPQTFSSYSLSGTISKSNTDRLIQLWHEFAQRLSISLTWLGPGTIAKSYETHDLMVINDANADRWADPQEMKPLLRKAYTDNFMVVLEEACFMLIRRGDAATNVISVKEFSEILDNAVQEIRNGVNLWIDPQVVVGRKPIARSSRL